MKRFLFLLVCLVAQAATDYKEPVNVRWFGAKGDGVTDDTTSVQAALTYGATTGAAIFFPQGTYITTNLTVGSNTKITGIPGLSIIQRKPEGIASDGYYVFGIYNQTTQVTNVVIEDIVLKGSVAADDFGGVAGTLQHSHSVVVQGASDVTFNRVTFRETRGDCIYIGADHIDSGGPGSGRHNTNIVVNGCTFDNSGHATYGYYPMRNGISIIDCVGSRIVGNMFSYVSAQTNQASPDNPTYLWKTIPGPIDFEPNNTDDIVQDAVVSDNTFVHCGGYATINLALKDGALNPPHNFLISNNTIRQCRGSAFQISDPNAPDSAVNCTIEGNTVHTMWGNGRDWGRPFYVVGGYGVKFVDNVFRNTESPGIVRDIALVIPAVYAPGLRIGNIKDIEFRGNTFENTTFPSEDSRGGDVANPAAIKLYQVTDVTIENNIFNNVGTNSVGYAIWVRGLDPADAYVDGLTVKNNQLRGANTTYLIKESDTPPATLINDSQHAYVSGNTTDGVATALISADFEYVTSTDNVKTYVAATGGLDWGKADDDKGVTSTLDAANILGLNEFSVVTTLYIPTSSTLIHRIWSTSVSGTFYPILTVYLNGDDLIARLFLNGSDNRYAQITDFCPVYGGRILQLAFVRNNTADTVAFYVDGNAVPVSTYINVGTPATGFHNTDLTGTVLDLGHATYDTGTAREFEYAIYNHALFSYALTASEIDYLTSQWIPAAMRWGAFGGTPGAILDYDLSKPWGGKAFDNSSYAQHGTVDSSLTWLLPNDVFVKDAISYTPTTGAGKAAAYAATDSDTVTRIALKNSDGTMNSFQTMGVTTLSVTTSAAVPNLTSTNYLKLLNATASRVLVTDGSQYVTNSTIAIADVKTTRVGVVREIWVPASAMNPFATAGAAFTTNTWATTTDGQAIEAYDFDDATDEAVQFTLSLPLAWNGADPKMKIFWKPVSEEDGYTNIWGAVAGSLANNDDGGNTLGTPATVEDVGLTSTNKLHISPAITVDVGNTPTAGDMIWFKVYRDANAVLDELVGDARLLGVMIQYTETTTEPSAW